MRDTAVRCRGLGKRYGGVLALERLDLEVESGQVLALLGPSGCGKTTALRLIAGFEVPDTGRVEVGGRVVAGPGVFVPPERRRIGMVFQEYALFPHLSVEQNVAFGLPRAPGRTGRVEGVMELVGLTEERGRMPHQLSGGQQQRVALARALAPGPEVLLLDEPFSNLDPGLRAQVREEVRGILAATSTTTVFVTHDQEEALLMGDVVAVLSGGHLEQIDTPERVYHSPETRFVAGFMGVADFLPARYEGGALWTELGPVAWLSDAPPPPGTELMVRPDDLVLTPYGEGQGTIRGRTFQGAFYLYEVALASGLVVRCLQAHTRLLEMGQRVQLRLSMEHRPVCFAEGRLYPWPD